MANRELPDGKSGEEIYKFAKRYGVKAMLDDLFISTAKIAKYKQTVEKVSHRNMMLMHRQLIAETRLLWANHKNEGLIIWYQSIISCYMAETLRCIATGKTSGDSRSVFVAHSFTQSLEEYLLMVMTVYPDHAAYERSLQRPIDQ